MLSPALLRRLYQGRAGPCPGVCNPYRDEDPALDQPGAARQRRRNLEAYLERVGRPRLMLLGEALGFRGSYTPLALGQGSSRPPRASSTTSSSMS